MQEEQLYPECGQDERTSVYQVTVYLPLPFREKKRKKHSASIYGNLLPVFSTGGSRLGEK